MSCEDGRLRNLTFSLPIPSIVPLQGLSLGHALAGDGSLGGRELFNLRGLTRARGSGRSALRDFFVLSSMLGSS